VGFNRDYSLSRELWNGSIDDLLTFSPDNVHYFFMSYAEDSATAMADIQAMRDRVELSLGRLAAARRVHWRPRLHFVSQPASSLPGWIPETLRALGGMAPTITARWEAEGTTVTRRRGAEGDSGWLPSLADVGPITARLAWYGRACNAADGTPSPPAQDVSGKVALVERGDCAFHDKVLNAQRRGALAALIFTNDQPVVVMGCNAPCEPRPTIPAALIEQGLGAELRQLLEAGGDISLSMELAERGVAVFAIDRMQRLREMGLLYYVGGQDPPSLTFTTHETRHYNLEWQREAQMASQAATVIAVFQGDRITGDLYGEIELPSAERMAEFDSMHFDLALWCTDHRDRNCGPWDYLANMYLCDAADAQDCSVEIARWITTYGREGRWVTDVSPMLALFADGGTRRVRLSMPASQQYDVHFSVRLSDSDADTSSGRMFAPLFAGGPFDAGYNARYQPLRVRVPTNATHVQLVALITGHGWGVELANCAEFCRHTHHFSVNGREYVKDHPRAGTQLGCVEQIEDGVVPNQFGTWHFGRGGWCPGLDVAPWSVDVTEQMQPGGWATISYRSLVGGRPYVPQPNPDPTGGFPARIDMTSYLVFDCDGPCQHGEDIYLPTAYDGYAGR
jgi:hypothetical protein